MAQQVIKARVRLSRDTPPEYIHPTMDFVFEQRGSEQDLSTADLDTMIQKFFSGTVTNQTGVLQQYMSTCIQHNVSTHQISYYDITGKLNGAPAGSPIATTLFMFSGTKPAGPALPDQASICLSYQADLTGVPEFEGDTRPAASRRGRIYFGPLLTQDIGNDSNGDCQFNAGMMADMARALWGLTSLTGHDSTNDPQLVVWSRKEAAVFPVANVWVNNLPDVRRHRIARRAATKFWWPSAPASRQPEARTLDPL